MKHYIIVGVTIVTLEVDSKQRIRHGVLIITACVSIARALVPRSDSLYLKLASLVLEVNSNQHRRTNQFSNQSRQHECLFEIYLRDKQTFVWQKGNAQRKVKLKKIKICSALITNVYVKIA